jgi:predicted TIM-barrel fold metal-dependent hydrolase
MIVDTHLHIIDKGALSYPWLSGEPALDRDFSYEEYAREARRCGITDSLFMEVDVAEPQMEAEIAYVEAKSKEPGSMIRGAFVACRPESEDFPAYLERQQANPFVKGFRRVLHFMPDELSDGATFRSNIKRMNGSGLSFDLVVLPRQLKRAMQLVDLAPDVQFVLDHCGVPDIKAGMDPAWRSDIGEISMRPNIVAKISGVVAYADPGNWEVETLRPFVEHTIGSFGWERVVWGSDWPVCTLGGGLSSWVAATHALTAGASADERRKLLSDNARRIWSL